MVSVVGLGLIISKDQVIQQTTEQLMTVADLKSEQVLRWLSEGQHYISLIADLQKAQGITIITVDSPDQPPSPHALEELDTLLTAAVETHPDFLSLSILHPFDGHVIKSTDPTQEGLDRSREEYFLKGREETTNGSLTYTIDQEAPHLYISSPLFDKADRLMAVLAAKVDLSGLKDILSEESGLGETGVSYLVEMNGFYVAAPSYIEGRPLRTRAESEGIRRATTGINGYGVYMNPEGIQVSGVYRWLHDLNLGLLVEIEEAEVQTRILSIWRTIILVSAVVFVGASIVTFRMANWLISPLDQIAKTARSIRAGDLSRRITFSGSDEMEKLASDFNEMAASVEQSRDNLETLLEQRAVELARANSLLQQEIAIRNRVEQELRESEEWFRARFNGAPDAIILFDNETGEILEANPVAADLLGKPISELIGLHHSKIHPIAHDGQFDGSASLNSQRYMSSAAGWPVEDRVLRSDGREIPVEVTAQLINVQEKSVVQTVFRNITKHKKTEKELQEANRLLTEALTDLRNAQEKIIGQERLAAVGQLAAGIAHDFNNILVPINLYTEMLLLEPEISESGRDGLTTILEQAKRAASLTEQILDFSRSAVMDSQVLNLSSFLNEFMKIIRRTLPETIFIELVTDGDDCAIRADPARMQQVFMNLALNARDAMPNGGELRIELSQLTVKPTGPPPYRDMAPGEWIRVTVSDSGIGIQPDHLQRIFEPFYTTKEPGDGTGLGLAQVYGIVKQHGGYIHVESRPEDGTIFIIYLPALSGEEEEESRSEIETTIMGQLETILVVEDDEAAQKAVRDTLKTLNYRVLTANNGAEALEIVEREKVNLVLSDLVMPEMGGVELFKILKKKFPEIKMIVMTGYPLKGGTKELIGRSQLDWLQKPLDMETLTSLVGKMLNKEVQ